MVQTPAMHCRCAATVGLHRESAESWGASRDLVGARGGVGELREWIETDRKHVVLFQLMSMPLVTALACVSVVFFVFSFFLICHLSLFVFLGCVCFNARQGFTHVDPFRVSFSKDKRFRISLDKWQQWRCGNGTLVPEETPHLWRPW